MSKHALQLGSWLLIASAALLTACADAPLGLDRGPAGTAQLAALLDFAQPDAVSTGAASLDRHREPDLGACDDLQVPAGNNLVSHLYATGVQIYRWNGTTWSFVAPSAQLFADAGGKGTVGTHYAGPTWESLSGSKVVGTVRERCTADASAIAWLLLEAVSSQGPGIFQGVTFIQRVNTVGGLAPATAGSFPGEEVGVPYTTEYSFYRAQ